MFISRSAATACQLELQLLHLMLQSQHIAVTAAIVISISIPTRIAATVGRTAIVASAGLARHVRRRSQLLLHKVNVALLVRDLVLRVLELNARLLQRLHQHLLLLLQLADRRPQFGARRQLGAQLVQLRLVRGAQLLLLDVKHGLAAQQEHLQLVGARRGLR